MREGIPKVTLLVERAEEWGMEGTELVERRFSGKTCFG